MKVVDGEWENVADIHSADRRTTGLHAASYELAISAGATAQALARNGGAFHITLIGELNVAIQLFISVGECNSGSQRGCRIQQRY